MSLKPVELLACLIALLVVYIGSYLALLQPFNLDLYNGQSGTRYRSPWFRIGGPVTARVFQPMLWVDRQVRPNFWQPQRLFYGSNGMYPEDEIVSHSRDSTN